MARKGETFWIFTFFCFWSCATCLLSSTGVNFEVQALMGIKAGLKDPHGVLDNWDGVSVDPCSWTMVTCSAESLVIGLGTPSQNLFGSLSPSIGNLKNLQFILLQNNNITGPIPAELGKLSKLQTLDLSDNFFTGSIPPPLGHLKTLQYMRLNNNSLSGEIPMSLANMTQLSLVDLSFNNLTGPLPRFPSKTLNIVGNPSVCPTGSEPPCHGVTLIPMSMTLNTSEIASLPSGRRKSHNFALALSSSIGCIGMLILGFGLFLWTRKWRKQQKYFDVEDGHHEEISLGNLRRFRLRELQIATNNFSSKNLLGKGGFGNVYKGYLLDGTAVAVKWLKDSSAVGGERQFQTEVEMISLAVHRNLLRLYGFCMTSTEKLLVYPYMSNGSVASRLKAKPVLDWGTRKQIALGAARGLLYLHEQCDPKIIHRDVKAANILLDDYCEAVVGDFGLAKLLDHQDSHVTTAVRGTVGHIAPEYLSTGQSSEKTDVFGFGVLLLELTTGQRALEFGKAANQKVAMLDWVKKLHQEKRLNLLVDKDLKNKCDLIELEEIVQVALLCTQYLPSYRPKMSEVVRMLEGDGLVERWEASQRAEASKNKTQELILSERYSDLTNDSSLLVQAIELSGPSGGLAKKERPVSELVGGDNNHNVSVQLFVRFAIAASFAGKNEAKTIIEARKAELDLAICITEGISQHDVVLVKAAINKQSKTQLIGPNCPGIIKPREFSLGQSTCVEIGGGTFNGTEFVYCIEKFLADLQTKSGTKKPIGASIESSKTIIEARKAELDLAICITEGISQHDVVLVKAAINKQSKTQLIGPNCPGIIKPREFSLGQSTCVEIGGGTFNGTEFVYCIEKFLADLQTKSGTKKPIGASIESCKDHIWQVIRTSSISSYYLDDYTGGVYRWQDGAIVANNPTNFTV
ncbi:unnamed protein product [Fraxinus pennsylvanica]|uniref:non-specific serine/threonine protein kinase n=1 Tax=Fraxinus pennsylvanica TaxID=56036 RepID=A0AAD2DTZ6_9LAMI|nr:unnamed protein product [Fraxinus pennsylvanica]